MHERDQSQNAAAFGLYVRPSYTVRCIISVSGKTKWQLDLSHNMLSIRNSRRKAVLSDSLIRQKDLCILLLC